MAKRNSTDSARARRRRAQRAVLSGGALVGGLAGPLFTAGPAQAQFYEVTSLADDGGGAATTLREAIEAADANTGPDTISFQAGLAGPILLVGGQLAGQRQRRDHRAGGGGGHRRRPGRQPRVLREP